VAAVVHEGQPARLASEELKVIRTPVQAANANAHMERWVGTVRRECLDRLLLLGRRQLEHVLRVYVRHYNRQRPQRALDLRPPEASHQSAVQAESAPHDLHVSRRDLLGRPHPRLRHRRRSVKIEFLHPTGYLSSSTRSLHCRPVRPRPRRLVSLNERRGAELLARRRWWQPRRRVGPNSQFANVT
jgi:hypothetical protein